MSDYPSNANQEALPLFDASGQGALFENPQAPKPAVSRQVSRDTRREAHRRAQGGASEQCKAVLQLIREAGAEGVTRKEMADRTDILLQSICARVNELLNPKDGSPPQVFQDDRRNGSAVLKAKGHV